jgi:hypothetical protein
LRNLCKPKLADARLVGIGSLQVDNCELHLANPISCNGVRQQLMLAGVNLLSRLVWLGSFGSASGRLAGEVRV